MGRWRDAAKRRRAEAAVRQRDERVAQAHRVLREERKRIAAAWGDLARENEALLRAATTILRRFLDGVRPPNCLERKVIHRWLDEPSSRQAWQWLIDNGLMARRVEPADLPIRGEGPHRYGHYGFNGYCVSPEARVVVRRVFGPEVWTET